MATYTFQQYIRALAYALDDLAVAIVSASSGTTVASNDIADTTAGASADRFNGRWIYSCESGLQRRVKNGSFVPSSGTVTYNFSATAVSVGTELQLTGLFPTRSSTFGDDTSYAVLINRALAKILVPDRITVPITTADSLSLAAYRWLDRPQRLVQLLEPPPVGTRPVDAMWRGPQLVLTGGVPSLQLNSPFDVAFGSVTLEVLRPGDTLVNGVETAPGVGMTTETQTATAPLEDVLAVAKMEAFQALMNRNDGVPGNWSAGYQMAKEDAERMFFFDGAMYKRKAPEPEGAAA